MSPRGQNRPMEPSNSSQFIMFFGMVRKMALNRDYKFVRLQDWYHSNHITDSNQLDVHLEAWR